MFIEIDEVEDVACSVRHVLRCWQFLKEDPQAQKWIFLALHSALQGACVCHLVSTAQPIGVVKNPEEWIEYFKAGSIGEVKQRPETKLLSLPELVKGLRNPKNVTSQSKAIAVSDSEYQWVLRIHKQIRNQFIHFEPTGWLIDISGIPDFAKLVSRIIGDIVQSGWAFRNLPNDKRALLEADLDELSSLVWPE